MIGAFHGRLSAKRERPFEDVPCHHVTSFQEPSPGRIIVSKGDVAL